MRQNGNRYCQPVQKKGSFSTPIQVQAIQGQKNECSRSSRRTTLRNWDTRCANSQHVVTPVRRLNSRTGRLLRRKGATYRSNLALCVPFTSLALCQYHAGDTNYILVCYDIFKQHVKLYPPKAATTMACLSKLINHCFLHIIKPEVILSNNDTQFHSPSWKRNWESLNVQVRYTKT